MDSSLDSFFKKAYAAKKKLTEAFLAKVAHAVLSALVHLHTKNYMHRDIKPSNILINKNGEIRVCDFGVSGKLVNQLSSTQGKGSLNYMSVRKIGCNIEFRPY